MAYRGKLLTLGNAKTVKGEKQGVLTAILHLAPSDLSGFNVCPMARKASTLASGGHASLSQCASGCLNTAGRGGIAAGGLLTLATIVGGIRTNEIQAARIRRTRFLYENRKEFVALLIRELHAAARKAARKGFALAVRLNGTSDLDWRAIFASAGHNIETVMSALRGICGEAYRYDYTKVPAMLRQHGEAYHLTYSLHDGAGSEKVARKFLARGGNVAVVFRSKVLPPAFLGAPVLNGDETDLRFADAPGHIVGLYAKGNARKDQTGFVREAIAA